jgi:hypothetical protein
MQRNLLDPSRSFSFSDLDIFRYGSKCSQRKLSFRLEVKRPEKETSQREVAESKVEASPDSVDSMFRKSESNLFTRASLALQKKNLRIQVEFDKNPNEEEEIMPSHFQ